MTWGRFPPTLIFRPLTPSHLRFRIQRSPYTKRKKTKAYGLVPHHPSLDRVARFARTPALKRPTAKAVVRSAPWLCSYEPPDTVYFTLSKDEEKPCVSVSD